MLVVVSHGPLAGCLYFLEACCCGWPVKGPCRANSAGTRGTCMPRGPQGHQRNWLRTLKYHGTIWHTFVVPSFAVPNFACPDAPPPPPPRRYAGMMLHGNGSRAADQRALQRISLRMSHMVGCEPGGYMPLPKSSGGTVVFVGNLNYDVSLRALLGHLWRSPTGI